MIRRRLAVPLSLSLVALVLLVSVASAHAKPAVTLTPEVLAGGLGGHSAIDVDLHMAGTEYGGFPPPTTEVVFTLPPGSTLGAGDHPTCPTAVLEQTGPKGCSLGSVAGPAEKALTIVSFGSERVEETATVESFFAPGGGFNLFVEGHSPTSLEVLISATVDGTVASLSVPRVSTVPGAPFASFEMLSFGLGESSAEEASSHLQSGLILPSECPTGKLAWAASVTFDENGSFPPTPEKVETATESGCPAVSPEQLQRIHQKEEEAAAKKKAEEEAAKHAEEALDKSILAALEKAIAASGKHASLGTLLGTAKLRLSFTAPTPGRLLVDWYEVPAGAHLSRKAHPILVASASANFRVGARKSVALKLTRKGRRLLEHVRRISLTAKGVFTPSGKAVVTAVKRFSLKQ